MGQIRFIAGKFAENKHEFVPILIENLKETKFISINKEFHKICNFFSAEIHFIRTFLPNCSLPDNWSEINLRPLFVKLGLRTSVSLNEILFVASQFSQGLFEHKTLPILLEEFARMLENFNFEKVIQTDLEILHRIRNLQFLPVWKCTDISHPNDLKKSRKKGRFSEAQLYENQNCCCTSSWIHMYSFHFPVSSLVEMFG